MLYYLAARYSRREELNGYADILRAAGHRVEARWLLGEHQIHDGALTIDDEAEDTPDVGELFANDDIEDLEDADVIVCFTEKPRSGASRGGRHVEFGMAYAWGMRLVRIGPRENVFYCLPEVEGYSCWDEFWEQECVTVV